MFCPKCGREAKPQQQFCEGCGTNFGSPAAIATSVSGTAAAPAFAPAKRYGGFWIRFLAVLIDAIIIDVVVIPVSFLLSGSIGVAGSIAHMPMLGIQIVGAITGFVLGLFANWLYHAFLESSSRQATVGKMALGLKVTDLYGRRISFGRATGRYFAKFISGLTLFIGYIIAGFTERHQALHDMIAGTLVEKV